MINQNKSEIDYQLAYYCQGCDKNIYMFQSELHHSVLLL